MDLSNFHFLRPWWLLLIPVSVWICIRIARQTDPLRGWRRFIERELLAAVTRSGERHSTWRFVLPLVFWLGGITALAGPTWRPEPSPFADNPEPAIILLSLAESIETADLLPSRLERARLKVVDLAKVRDGQPTGLIAYAGTAHVVLPPTRDTEIVGTMAAELSPRIMPKSGNRLDTALQLADKLLEETCGSIIVVTDTVPAELESSLEQIAAASPNRIQFLAVAQSQSPDLESIERVAGLMDARIVPIAADASDIDLIDRTITRAARSFSVGGDAQQWAEAGWWLVPLIALIALNGFRRTRIVE